LNASGTYHVAGRDVISRYDFAMAIARVFSLATSLITAITTDQLKQAAPRPMKSGLVVEKAMQELGVQLSEAEEGLQTFKKVLEASSPF